MNASMFRLPPGTLVLTGPTASGKTSLGVAVAKLLDAEIISLDSMAIFRGMDIGTAKPNLEERQGVRHHLIDVVQPDQDYSLAQYVRDVESVFRELAQRKRRAIVVGGTPLYLKALLRGIFQGPAADWDLRASLDKLAENGGDGALHKELSAIDPASAARLHANDARRLIRAIEVYRLTGTPLSEHQRQWEDTQRRKDCAAVVLDWPREALNKRIEQRVDQMFAAGFVDEVRALLARFNLSRTAGQALGYRETREHLQGERDISATIELVKLRTRQFAKRQMTWYRSLSECQMVAAGTMDAADVVDHYFKRS